MNDITIANFSEKYKKEKDNIRSNWPHWIIRKADFLNEDCGESPEDKFIQYLGKTYQGSTPLFKAIKETFSRYRQLDEETNAHGVITCLLTGYVFDLEKVISGINKVKNREVIPDKAITYRHTDRTYRKQGSFWQKLFLFFSATGLPGTVSASSTPSPINEQEGVIRYLYPAPEGHCYTLSPEINGTYTANLRTILSTSETPQETSLCFRNPEGAQLDLNLLHFEGPDTFPGRLYVSLASTFNCSYPESQNTASKTSTSEIIAWTLLGASWLTAALFGLGKGIYLSSKKKANNTQRARARTDMIPGISERAMEMRDLEQLLQEQKSLQESETQAIR